MNIKPHEILIVKQRSIMPPEHLEQYYAIVAQEKARDRFRKVFGSYPPALISGVRLKELFDKETQLGKLLTK